MRSSIRVATHWRGEFVNPHQRTMSGMFPRCLWDNGQPGRSEDLKVQPSSAQNLERSLQWPTIALSLNLRKFGNTRHPSLGSAETGSNIRFSLFIPASRQRSRSSAAMAIFSSVEGGVNDRSSISNRNQSCPMFCCHWKDLFKLSWLQRQGIQDRGFLADGETTREDTRIRAVQYEPG